MSGVVIVTGSGGLIGSEAARHFAARGSQIVGIDNDMRAYFFGPGASTRWNVSLLSEALGSAYEHNEADIRDREQLATIFRRHRGRIRAVIHTAAQPSHDWAAREPGTDFAINATGTLNLLELARECCPESPFVFTSTNKVYGDTPNRLPLVEQELRLELPASHPYYEGIDETMSLDQSMHSIFGASKVAADVLTQEYGRYFNMPTACFRGGCLTGPSHSGAELHGFLSYLVKCAATGTPYTVFGYGGRQVRDNLHSADLIGMFDAFVATPRSGEVYNAGGGRFANCSVLEARALAEELTGRPMNITLSDQARAGDHMWWISSLKRFQDHYPSWQQRYDLRSTMVEILDANRERWTAAAK